MLLLPKGIPAASVLRAEGYDVDELSRDAAPREYGAACRESIRIAFLNLMPEKEQALTDICRVLSFSDMTVEIVPLKFRGRKYKVASQQYMEQFYADVEDVLPDCYDALLVNGAPVEKIPFEDVDYWDSLCRLMDMFSSSETPQLYICWAAQAALYHFYGIPKYILGEKRFGIFRHHLSGTFRQTWNIASEDVCFPVSRHTEIRAADIRQLAPSLDMAAVSEESGVGIVTDARHHRSFITAHSEYDRERLAVEYRRDIGRGLPIHVPEHYFQDDDPSRPVLAEWHSDARAIFRAWLLKVKGFAKKTCSM